MLYVLPFKLSNIFLLFLMFSLIFKLDNLYIILLGLSVMSQLLFGNKFGSLEKSAADI